MRFHTSSKHQASTLRTKQAQNEGTMVLLGHGILVLVGVFLNGCRGFSFYPAFGTSAHHLVSQRWSLLSKPNDNDNGSETELIVSADEMEKQLATLRNKYPTAEADYLAAARARSVEKTESQECKATDQDWQYIKQQKEQKAATSDSVETSEEDNDSQILVTASSDDENEEPKLLLF